MCQPDQFIPAFDQLIAPKAIEASVEHEVLKNRQFVVERKLLGHVTDQTFDPVQLAHDIQAGDATLSFAGFEQPAQHANDGGLAGAVGAEKSENGAFLDFEGDVINGGEVAEPFGQPFAFNHCLACHEESG